MHFINENDLDNWVRGNAQLAQGLVVELVAKLVAASSPKPRDRRFPLGDSIGQHGPDGYLDAIVSHLPFVPEGKSFWEIGTSEEAKKKATGDYKDLTATIPKEIRLESTFIFVTPISGRKGWKHTPKKDGQITWLEERRKTGEWKDVRVIDGTKLIEWVHQFIAIGYDNLVKNFQPHQKESLDRTLTGLLFRGPRAAADSLREFTKSPDQYTPSSKMSEINEALSDAYRQMKAAGCEAIGKVEDLSSQKIFGGKLTPILNLPDGLCDCRTLKSQWNPNDYKITNFPVVYINGDSDPATPIESAKKHFEGQDLVSEKIFLAIPGGGHAEAAYPHGKISSCFPLIFESLASGSVASLKRDQEKLQSRSCTSPSQIEKGIRGGDTITR